MGGRFANAIPAKILTDYFALPDCFINCNQLGLQGNFLRKKWGLARVFFAFSHFPILGASSHPVGPNSAAFYWAQAYFQWLAAGTIQTLGPNRFNRGQFNHDQLLLLIMGYNITTTADDPLPQIFLSDTFSLRQDQNR